MSATIDVERQSLPPAPPCPSWCHGHSPATETPPGRDGWDTVGPVDVYKTCRWLVLDSAAATVEVRAVWHLAWPVGVAPFPVTQFSVVNDGAAAEVDVFEDHLQPDALDELAAALVGAAVALRGTAVVGTDHAQAGGR